MIKTSEKLIERLKSDDSHAQQELLTIYGEIVFRQIARIVFCQEDAEEVYQDVFLKAFRHIGSYDITQASLSTWLSRIAYNESLNFIRKRKPPILYVDDRETDLESI